MIYKSYSDIWISIAIVIRVVVSGGLLGFNHRRNGAYQNDDDDKADQPRGRDVDGAGGGAIVLRPLQVTQHLAVSGL